MDTVEDRLRRMHQLAEETDTPRAVAGAMSGIGVLFVLVGFVLGGIAGLWYRVVEVARPRRRAPGSPRTEEAEARRE